MKTISTPLAILSAVLTMSGCSGQEEEAPPAQVMPTGSVVVLGIDGLDRVLLERLAREGQLPSFARVMGEGVVVDMRVSQPILSPRIWTSIASGYAPEVHGVLDWVRPDGKPYRAGDVRVERVWDAASAAGKTVLVSGWLMTTPVTEIRGVMLSDEIVIRGSLDMYLDPNFKPRRDPSVLDGWLAWPKSQLAQAENWTPGSAWLRSQTLGYQVEAYGAGLHPLARDETHARSLEALGPTLPADLSMVYLSGADQISHQFWPFVDPRGVAAMQADPGLRQRSATQLLQMHAGKRRVPLSDGPTSQADIDTGARWIVDYYRYLDQVLARVLIRLEKTESTLLICSDHGFQVGDRPVPLFADHRNPALLIGWGALVRPGARPRAEVTMLDIAPTLYAMLGIPAASDMRGRMLDDLFALQALPPIPSRVRVVAGAVPGAPADHPRRSQLEALGYIDGDGAPIPQPGSP
jgi:hypothetical protein